MSKPTIEVPQSMVDNSVFARLCERLGYEAVVATPPPPPAPTLDWTAPLVSVDGRYRARGAATEVRPDHRQYKQGARWEVLLEETDGGAYRGPRYYREDGTHFRGEFPDLCNAPPPPPSLDWSKPLVSVCGTLRGDHTAPIPSDTGVYHQGARYLVALTRIADGTGEGGRYYREDGTHYKDRYPPLRNA